MSYSIDLKLKANFKPDSIFQAFEQYENAKRDIFCESKVEICMGADGISYETFKNELRLRSNLISKRVVKGTYQFYPFREIKVPKAPAGERVLSIASIRDVIVQKLLYKTIYEDLEKKFGSSFELDNASWAYRQGKAIQVAVSKVHNYIKKGYRFVLDADIVKFFDNIPHQDLFILIEKTFGENSLTTNLVKKFIKTGGTKSLGQQKLFHKRKATRKSRTIGIPQGGVLSGALANLYLHSFDCWVIEKLSRRVDLRYVRYADDFIILLRQESDLLIVHEEVKAQLASLKLELHGLGTKTRHIDIINDGLSFIGFCFDGQVIRIKEDNIKRFQKRIQDKIRAEHSYNFRGCKEKRFELFIGKVINRKILGSGRGVCSTCGGLTEEKMRSWISFFPATTDLNQLRELDKWIRQAVSQYFWKNYQLSLKRCDFRNARLASLEQEYYRLRKQVICECPCLIE